MKLHVTSDVEPKVTIKGIQVKSYNLHKGLHGTYKFGDHFFEIRDGILSNIDPITKKDFLWAHCGIQI